MIMSFRWYGEKDPVTLEKIRQIPSVTNIVSAIYDVPVGEVWPMERILALKKAIVDAGLKFEVVESVPVHEDIKLGNSNAAALIKNYRQNIINLGKAGVKCICYNFMPVFDWLRTNLKTETPDGSNALSYDDAVACALDPSSCDLSLAGWDASYKKEDLAALLQQYKAVDEEKLWENLSVFLREIIPVAQQAGVKMAIHPDDPPWSVFGLPRIITNQANLDRFLSIVDSPYNGLTFCTGSLGVAKENDLIGMIHRYRGRINFVHVRNVKLLEGRSFIETGHLSSAGSLDVAGIVKALVETGFDEYVRPDHGRMIWGEQGRGGYGLYDRALGAGYIAGLDEAFRYNK